MLRTTGARSKAEVLNRRRDGETRELHVNELRIMNEKAMHVFLPSDCCIFRCWCRLKLGLCILIGGRTRLIKILSKSLIRGNGTCGRTISCGEYLALRVDNLGSYPVITCVYPLSGQVMSIVYVT